jgi:hypothetical protein
MADATSSQTATAINDARQIVGWVVPDGAPQGRRAVRWDAGTHTFASQWVMAGASIEKLKEILGHYSVVMTERYAHLRPDLFPASDLGTIRVDLFAGGAEVVQLRLKNGSSRRKAPRKGAEEKKMVGAAL